MLVCFALALPLASCGLFGASDIGRPGYFVVPEPTTVRVDYRAGGGGAQVNPLSVRIQVLARSEVSDLTLTAYRLDYFDQAGLPLAALSQARQVLAPPLRLTPPVAAAALARAELPLAPVTRAVEDHGKAFLAGAGGRGCISCRVTLFGRLAGSENVELVTTIPVCFEDVQASPTSVISGKA